MSAVGGGLARIAMHAGYLPWALSLFYFRKDDLEEVSVRWFQTQEEVRVRWTCQRNCSTWAMSGSKVPFSEFIILAPSATHKKIWEWRLAHHDSCCVCISCHCFSGTPLRMQVFIFRLGAGPEALTSVIFSFLHPSRDREGSLDSQDSQKSNNNLRFGISRSFSSSALRSQATPLSIPFLAWQVPGHG